MLDFYPHDSDITPTQSNRDGTCKAVFVLSTSEYIVKVHKHQCSGVEIDVEIDVTQGIPLSCMHGVQQMNLLLGLGTLLRPTLTTIQSKQRCSFILSCELEDS